MPDCVVSHTRTKRGKSYKLCPYSTEYLEPLSPGCTIWPGKSLDFPEGAPTPAAHLDTEGRMSIHSRGRSHGWVCWSETCPYYTTVNPGVRFFEI